jgi:hypothetical protein
MASGRAAGGCSLKRRDRVDEHNGRPVVAKRRRGSLIETVFYPLG